MNKEESLEAVEKFKDLEKKLVEVLNSLPTDISKEGKKTEKENIKSYIDKVSKARKIFDEYEQLAEKLTEITAENENDQDSIEISKKVIESREENSNINEKDLIDQYKLIEKQTKGLEKVEIETLGDTVVVKKKKKDAVASKEL